MTKTLTSALLVLLLTTAPCPAGGPTVELGTHIEKTLSARPAEGETWSFGVTADPHIYMYDWSDGQLAATFGRWAKARADFGVVVGDFGTGKSLQKYGEKMVRQQDVFAETIKKVPACPPVVLSIGNHEMEDEGKISWLNAMYPGVVKGVEGTGNERFFYYSFDHRGCHFVSLDANHVPPGKRQVLGVIPEDEFDWLEKDLAANKGKLTFVFLHEPIEQAHYDTPYYLLTNRARLLDILRRHPDVKWTFHGHLHYAEHVKAWGLNIIHCGQWFVRVTGQSAELCQMTREGKLVPVTKVYDLGAELAKRLGREGDKAVYRVAEDSLEAAGRNCSLKKGTSLVAAEGDIKPTRGEKMMKVSVKLGAREKGNSFTHLTRYLSTVDVIPIVKGMSFSYDVRSEGSPYDNFALDLRIVMPDGQAVPKIADAAGLPMNNIHQYRSPSLGGRADGKWYHRQFDLSAAAGGWIDMITLCCTRPSGAAYPAGELKLYVDDVKFTWPAEK